MDSNSGLASLDSPAGQQNVAAVAGGHPAARHAFHDGDAAARRSQAAASSSQQRRNSDDAHGPSSSNNSFLEHTSDFLRLFNDVQRSGPSSIVLGTLNNQNP